MNFNISYNGISYPCQSADEMLSVLRNQFKLKTVSIIYPLNGQERMDEVYVSNSGELHPDSSMVQQYAAEKFPTHGLILE